MKESSLEDTSQLDEILSKLKDRYNENPPKQDILVSNLEACITE